MSTLKVSERVGYDLFLDNVFSAVSKVGTQKDQFFEREVKAEFKDGRTASGFAELFAQQLNWKINGKEVCFVRLPNMPYGADGHFIIGKQEKFVGVRCLTANPLKIQRSMYLGTRRPAATSKNLLDDLSNLDYYIICDISMEKFNCWKYWLVETDMLIDQVQKMNLNYQGWNQKKFYSFLRANKYKVA